MAPAMTRPGAVAPAATGARKLRGMTVAPASGATTAATADPITLDAARPLGTWADAERSEHRIHATTRLQIVRVTGVAGLAMRPTT